MSIIEVVGELVGYAIVIILIYAGYKWYKKNSRDPDKGSKKPIWIMKPRWQMSKEEIKSANIARSNEPHYDGYKKYVEGVDEGD